MKVGLGQMRVEPGRPDLNLARIGQLVSRATSEGCQVLALPELCVSGYLLGDQWTSDSFCRELMSANAELASLSMGLVLIYGNVYVDEGRINKDGRVRKYNAAYAWQDGKALRRGGPDLGLPNGVTLKTLHPDYRFFDDDRYFFSLKDACLDLGIGLEEAICPLMARVDGQELGIGVEICEDLWFTDYRYRGKPLNVSGFLIKSGAQAIVNISASPWTYGKGQARDRRIAAAKEDCGRFVPFYYVNCVGVQNNGKNFITFDGDSGAYGADARLKASLGSSWEEGLLVHDGDNAGADLKKPEGLAIAQKFKAAVEAIRAVDLLMGNGDFPWVIGMSGGVDSAVVACLLERAVGAKRVVGVNLPSRHNSQATRDSAAFTAGELGIDYRHIGIQDLVDLNRELLAPFKPSPLNIENIQAKVRGASLLSNIAAALGGLMTNNGNKLEIALGYATLYGDVNGAIAPIGDLLKTEVFSLARYLNQEVYGRPVVSPDLLPDELFNFGIAPSAELRDGQVDPMKWGYHDALLEAATDYRKLDALGAMRLYSQGRLAKELGLDHALLARYGLDEPRVFVEDLEWFFGCLRRSVFKRVQAPPIVIMSRGAFGYDIRESQLSQWKSGEYLDLRERLCGREGRA